MSFSFLCPIPEIYVSLRKILPEINFFLMLFQPAAANLKSRELQSKLLSGEREKMKSQNSPLCQEDIKRARKSEVLAR